MVEQIRISWEIHEKNVFSLSKPDNWDDWSNADQMEYIRQEVYTEIMEQIENYEIDEDRISCSYKLEKHKDV